MSTLKEQAQIIRDETNPGANTAQRVGDMFVNLVDEVEKKLSTGSLAQGTGSGTTTAMSQKAVTTALETMDKVYITQLDITTKTDKTTISEGDKTEINKIFEEANNGKIIYCPNVGLYATYRDDIWPNDISVIIGSILYSANISGSLWGISKRELYNEGGGTSGTDMPVLYYTDSISTTVSDLRNDVFDIETFKNTNIDAKIIRCDIAPDSMYGGPTFLAYDGDYYHTQWKAFGPYKSSDEYFTDGSGYYPKQDVVFGKYGNIELVHYDGNTFKCITYASQSGGPGGGISDAPSDGKSYLRKNAKWESDKVVYWTGFADVLTKLKSGKSVSSGQYTPPEFISDPLNIGDYVLYGYIGGSINTDCFIPLTYYREYDESKAETMIWISFTLKDTYYRFGIKGMDQNKWGDIDIADYKTTVIGG